MPLFKTLLSAAYPLNFFLYASTPSLRSKDPQTIKKEGGAAIAFKGKGVANTLEDHLGVFTGTVPKLFLAHFIWLGLNWASEKAKYAEFSQSWIVSIILRDLFLTYVVASFCDFVAYNKASPWYSTLKDFKFSPTYADQRPEKLLGIIPVTQTVHDMFWSTVSTLIVAAIEIYTLNAWATGKLPLNAPMPSNNGDWWRDMATVIWVLTMPYWRLAHFFFVHRGMHSWHTRSSEYWILRQIPDIGHWLYKNVHELHHKSKNPTAWSGVSMHPVESFTYYTAAFIPLIFGAHPIVFFYTKFDLTLAALIGHDGFAFPGGGSQPHWLHHLMVDVNYGENYAPFDYFFGSFAATEEEASNLREERNARKRKFKVALTEAESTIVGRKTE